MTKLEKLKAEVDRLLEGPAPSHDSQCRWEDGYWCALYKIQELLEEPCPPEPKFEIGDTIREKVNPDHQITISQITKCNYIGTNEDVVSFYSQDSWELVEKSLRDTVIDDMEKMSRLEPYRTPWALDSTGLAYPLHYAKLGASWQKRKSTKLLDKDLDEVAADYEEEMWGSGHPEDTYTSSDIIRAVKYGAGWQKQKDNDRS